jgi:superfamily II DNA or RNA helicase
MGKCAAAQWLAASPARAYRHAGARGRRQGDVFSLIGPKRYDVPCQEMEAQGWIAQRLGRILRPKQAGGRARFYAVVSRDTLDADYAGHRQRFLAEQGYAYEILDAADLLAG